MSGIGAGDLVQARLGHFPDFPKPGIVFRDLSAALADGRTFNAVIDDLVSGVSGIDLVAGVEARGFILAAAAARSLGCGVLPIRKAGKLPGEVASVGYDLEYGSAALELHPSSGPGGQRVLLLDDVLATGGTLTAAATLLERCGYVVAGVGVVLELADLGGRDALKQYPLRAITAV